MLLLQMRWIAVANIWLFLAACSTPISDVWWCLSWVSKPGQTPDKYVLLPVKSSVSSSETPVGLLTASNTCMTFCTRAYASIGGTWNVGPVCCTVTVHSNHMRNSYVTCLNSLLIISWHRSIFAGSKLPYLESVPPLSLTLKPSTHDNHFPFNTFSLNKKETFKVPKVQGKEVVLYW